MSEPRVKLGAVRERPGFGAGGDLIQFVDIPYTIEETGASGLVSIPKSQFSAELAQRLITDEAAELMRLHQAFGG